MAELFLSMASASSFKLHPRTYKIGRVRLLVGRLPIHEHREIHHYLYWKKVELRNSTF